MRNIKNWQTTLIGVIGAILIILTQFGVFTPDESVELESAITAIIGAITSIVLIFKAKD